MQQFRSFYFQNRPKDFEEAVETFALFGGLGWKLDLNIPLPDLIEEVILKNYDHFHKEIADITLSDSIYHGILTGIAMGDGRVQSAYKRARISFDIGKPAVRYLCNSGLIEREIARVKGSDDAPISDKLHFTTPFMRFWFAFVSPIFKGIQEGEYREFEQRYENRKHEFTDLIFVQLSKELIKKNFQDDPIVHIGGYWDKDVNIDIVAKTESGKTIAATCKYSNAKIKKNELTKLKEKCSASGIEADIFVIVSKRGFSNEIKSLKSKELRLFSVKNFKNLLEDMDVSQMIKGFTKL